MDILDIFLACFFTLIVVCIAGMLRNWNRKRSVQDQEAKDGLLGFPVGLEGDWFGVLLLIVMLPIYLVLLVEGLVKLMRGLYHAKSIPPEGQVLGLTGLITFGIVLLLRWLLGAPLAWQILFGGLLGFLILGGIVCLIGMFRKRAAADTATAFRGDPFLGVSPLGTGLLLFVVLCVVLLVVARNWLPPQVWEWLWAIPVAVGAFAIFYFVRDVLRALVLDNPAPPTAPLQPQPTAPSVATPRRLGIAVTALQPSGQVEIDGRRHDATTEGMFLDAGTPVEVLRTEAFTLVVRKKG